MESKKITFRFFTIIILLLPVAAIAHFVVFPQTILCLLIGLSSFEKDDGVYFLKGPEQNIRLTVRNYVDEATKRVTALYWSIFKRTYSRLELSHRKQKKLDYRFPLKILKNLRLQCHFSSSKKYHIVVDGLLDSFIWIYNTQYGRNFLSKCCNDDSTEWSFIRQ